MQSEDLLRISVAMTAKRTTANKTVTRTSQTHTTALHEVEYGEWSGELVSEAAYARIAISAEENVAARTAKP